MHVVHVPWEQHCQHPLSREQGGTFGFEQVSVGNAALGTIVPSSLVRGRSARSREGEERRSREGRGVGKSGRGKWWAVSDGGVFISDSARVSSDSAGGVLSFLPAVGLFLEIFPTVPAAW